MIANFVDGLGQKVGNNHIFWHYADLVEQMGAKVNRFTCNDDLRSALVEKPESGGNLWVVYSNGMGNLWRWIHEEVDEKAKYKDIIAIDRLICIAGVPRWLFGQFQIKLWNIPPCFTKATAFNVNSIPISCPIENESNDYENIWLHDCPVLAHVTIVHHPRVKEKILTVAENLL
jgi:hypothetical protein